MADSIDVGSGGVRRLKRALSDESPPIDLRIIAVIRSGSTVPTPASVDDEFHVGDKLIGSYVASARRFLHARLHLRRHPDPNPPRSSAPPLLGLANDDHLNPTGHIGGSWELDTTHMQPSDYVLTLRVVDRTLLDSSVPRWSSEVSIHFRLAPAIEPISAVSATSSGRGFSHVRRM